GNSYLQKRGICIGSCVAPVLCDVYLSHCDQAIAKNISANQVSRIFRYVDDYLVLLPFRPDEGDSHPIDSVRATFLEQAEQLNFTIEVPTDGILQFLDLQITFNKNQTCWMYHPRSKKRLLRYDSSHSKLVKRGIVSNCLSMALNKSCEHRAKSSFELQVTRLKASGYPYPVLTDIAEKLLTKNHKIEKNQREETPSGCGSLYPQDFPQYEEDSIHV
ncbi:unnamed protein product, partial [Ixodes pacificus]